MSARLNKVVVEGETQVHLQERAVKARSTCLKWSVEERCILASRNMTAKPVHIEYSLVSACLSTFQGNHVYLSKMKDFKQN